MNLLLLQKIVADDIPAGVTISGCSAGDTALSFSLMPFNASIIINNNETIAGAGGKGGNGARTASILACIPLAVVPSDGQLGGAAISTTPGVIITVNNYGLIAGGGGEVVGPSAVQVETVARLLTPEAMVVTGHRLVAMLQTLQVVLLAKPLAEEVEIVLLMLAADKALVQLINPLFI